MKSLKDTSFISFDTKTGTWKFSVEHFSRYGLLDDDDDEEETDENKGGNEVIIDNIDESVTVKEIKMGSTAPPASNGGRYRLGKFEAFMKAKERSVTLPGNHPNAKPLHTVFDIGGSLVQLYDKEGAILTREKLSESSFDSKVTSSARTIFDALFGPWEESRREKMDEWFRSELITQVQSMQVQNDGNVYYRVFFYVLSKQLKKAVECCLNNQLFQLAAVVAQSDKLDEFSKSLLTSEAVKVQTSRGSNEWYLNLLLLLSGDTDGLFSRAEKVFSNWVLVAAACFYFVLDESSPLEDLVLYLDDHFKSNNVEVDDISYRCLKAFIGDITFSEIFTSSDTGRIDPVDLYDLYVQYKPELDLILFKKLTFDPLHTVFDIGGSLVQLYDKEGAILTREKLSESSFDSKVTSSARTIFDALFGPWEESRREKMDEWFRSELITQVQSMQVQNDGNVYYRVFFYVLSKQLKKAVDCCLNNQLFQLATVVAQSDKLDEFSKSLLTSEAVKVQTSRGSNEWYLNLLLLLSGDTDGLFSRAEKVLSNWVLVAAACFYFVLDESSPLEDLVLYLDDHFKSNNVEVDDISYRCLKAFIGDITFSEIFTSSDTGRIDPVDLYDLYVQYKPELDLILFKKLTFDVFAAKNGKDCLFHLFELLKVSSEDSSIREFIKQVIVHGFRNSNTFKVENVSTVGIDESLSVDALSLLHSFDTSVSNSSEIDESLVFESLALCFQSYEDCMWKSCVFYARSNNNRQVKDLLHYHVLPALFLDDEYDVSKYLLVNLLADNEKVDNVFHQFYRLKDVKDRSLEDLQLFMRVFLHEVSMSKSHNTKPLYLASINEIGRIALKWMTYSHVEKSKLDNFIHHLGIKIVS
ncbi:hypothetical protein MP638_000158 [Amoeboaphelidium occidentale]|nr:hypothetical protein MP638_000158 [Amoeboaphelidium occidentale]